MPVGCFDICIGVIRYLSSHFVYWALYQRYPVWKILTFDIEVLAMDISYPTSKIFDIDSFYTISNLLISILKIDFDIEGLILSFYIKELYCSVSKFQL